MHVQQTFVRFNQNPGNTTQQADLVMNHTTADQTVALDIKETTNPQELYRGSYPQHCPELPLEIWLNIFEYATFVIGAYNTDVPDPFELPEKLRPTMYTVRTELYDALVTKRYIVRVCKAWHALGTPILYRALMIRKARIIPSLLATLASSWYQRDDNVPEEVVGTSSTSVSVGRYTLRLDINIGNVLGAVSGTEQAFLQTIDLVKYLSHLQIIACSGVSWVGQSYGVGVPLRVIGALQNHCYQSLHMISVNQGLETSQSQAWCDLASQCVHLRVLRLDRLWSQEPTFRPPLSGELKSCSSLEITGTIGDEFSSMELHILRRDSIAHLNYLQPFARHVTRVWATLPDRASRDWSTQIIASFPNLQQLVIIFETWSNLGPNGRPILPFDLPTSITHCGFVASSKGVVNGRLCSAIAIWLAKIKGSSLRTIRIMDSRTTKNFIGCRPAILTQCADQLMQSSIRLEDQDGVEITSSYVANFEISKKSRH